MRGKLSKRERLILSVTVALLLIVGGYIGVFEKLRERWSTLDEDINALALRLDASKASYGQELRIKREYEEVVNSLRIEGSESDKQIKIMQELSNLMEQANVSASNAKPLNIEEGEKFQIFYFSYDDTETNMVSLTRFLDLLERLSKVSEVQMIEIKPPSPPLYQPGEQRFKTSFKISRLVYRR